MCRCSRPENIFRPLARNFIRKLRLDLKEAFNLGHFAFWQLCLFRISRRRIFVRDLSDGNCRRKCRNLIIVLILEMRRRHLSNFGYFGGLDREAVVMGIAKFGFLGARAALSSASSSVNRMSNIARLVFTSHKLQNISDKDFTQFPYKFLISVIFLY